jgi:hypothetical protein
MATTMAADIKFNEELLRLGISEVIEQNVDAFNTASNNTIIMTTTSLEGNFSEEAFIKSLAASSLVSRRDFAADTALTPAKLIEDTVNTVKLSRRYGPVSSTYDAWNRSGRNIDTFSMAFGRQLGVAIMQDMVEACIAAGVTATQVGNTALGDGLSVFDYSNIVDGLASMGDKGGRIGCLVMHSNTYYSIVDQGLSRNALDTVGGMTIREGGAYSLGLPVLTVDSPSLILSAGIYGILGLTESALKAIESEDMIMRTQDVLLKDNLQMVMQGESSYNVGVKGYTFNISKPNPVIADIKTAANWTYKYADIKSGPGFVLKVAARA